MFSCFSYEEVLGTADSILLVIILIYLCISTWNEKVVQIVTDFLSIDVKKNWRKNYIEYKTKPSDL